MQHPLRFYCQARGSGSQAQGEPDPVPRGIRIQQQTSSPGHPGTTRQGRSKNHSTEGHRGCRNQSSCSHDVGPETQASIQHRCREVSSLRRCRQSNRRYRGQGSHRKNTHPPGQQGVVHTTKAIASGTSTAGSRLVYLIRRFDHPHLL